MDITRKRFIELFSGASALLILQGCGGGGDYGGAPAPAPGPAPQVAVAKRYQPTTAMRWQCRWPTSTP